MWQGTFPKRHPSSLNSPSKIQCVQCSCRTVQIKRYLIKAVAPEKLVTATRSGFMLPMSSPSDGAFVTRR